MAAKHRWTVIEDAFLRDAAKRHGLWMDVLAEYQEVFGEQLTYDALKSHAVGRLRLKLEKPHTYSPFSNEEKAYILESVGKRSLREIADGLESLTGRKSSRSAIGHYINDTLQIVPSGRRGGWHTGQVPQNAHEVGTTTKKSNGYIYVKVDAQHWKPKQEVVYEQAYGSIPDGSMVIFLNNDKTDFDIENLYCVSKGIHGMMCKNRWYTWSKEHTLAAIKLCELIVEINKEG